VIRPRHAHRLVACGVAENCRQNLCANTLSGTKKIRKFAEIIIKEWKK
jgi:hypothetical protein